MEQSQSGTNGIGQRLRELRQKRGLNQQDLASADISVSYVSLIETGKRAPSETVLKSLAERVGCTVDYLRTGRDDTRVKELELKIVFGDMALRNGANGEALQSYSEALANAPLLDEAMVRRAKLGQALAFEKLGRLEAAIQLFNALYDDPETTPGSAEWAQLAVALCRAYRDAGDQVMSVEVGERAMKQLDRLGLDVTDDHIQLGATLIGCYYNRGDLTQAQLLSNRLTQVAEENGSRVARGAVYWNAALVANSRGQAKESLALAERALALMAESDNVRHIGLLKVNCAAYLLEIDSCDLDHVAVLLTEAQETMLEVGTAAEQASVETYRARLALRQADPDAALERASRALGLLRNESRWESASARVVLAQAQFERGEATAGAETLHAVERQLGQIPVNRNTALVWRQAGDVWQLNGHPNEALAMYQHALSGVGLVPLKGAARVTAPLI
ncbi:transcriptional regulator with XRE-family HTH domain [Kitasatospora sp. GAS204A]|uniref:helix-turn-helix domain-containing protein n=1 Tax=unclassified Kitasatospora TaxID=2633591 RepID=UPI002474E348|nr:helix-turn-helix domain-containing protein [Kitasatospora sp. GAS204B]MDH6116705.1 transcriptional regulator with XRE-family HTH domain [Kitasatospora sp. GAS204B]